MKRRRKTRKHAKRSGFRIIFRIFIITVIMLCLLFGAASIYIYYKGNDLLKDYIVTTVERSSKGVYHLRLQKLTINLLTGRISLSGFHLVPDTAAYTIRSKTDTVPPILIDARVPSFQVRGFSIRDILLKREIDISRILVSSPELTIIMKKPSKKTVKLASSRNMLSVPLPPGVVSLRIRQISLEKGKLTIDDRTKQPAEKFIVPLIGISFENLLVDSIHKGTHKILNTDDIRISLKGMRIKTKNGMYTITPGEISLSTGKSTITVSNLKVTPNYSRVDFCRKLGYQADRMEISIGKILCQGMDLYQLLINRKFIIRSMLVDGLVLDDYRDKRVPTRPDFSPPLPQQALLASHDYIRIDKLKLTNGKVTYSEQTGDEPGSIFFDKMEGSVSGIINDSVLVRHHPRMHVNASMYLMGKALLNAVIDIPLGAKKDVFTFSATLSEMDLCAINPMLSKLLPAEIMSGTAEKMVMSSVHADDDKAVGRMDFYYKDLRIKMHPKTNSIWNKIKSGAMNWAASRYVRNENPKNGKFVQGIVYFERDKHKSIFNYLWKSTFSGLKSTMGINRKEQKELIKADKTKQKE